MLALAAISLTAPLMLLGLGMLGLPLAAHLLHRRARRVVVFPSLLLITQSAASQSRLFRLRHLLLLALRCLAMTLIVLAFAGPVWLDEEAASLAPQQPAAWVVLLDTSASTAQHVDGVPAAQLLLAAAQRVLNHSVQPGVDVANLILASAQPRAVLPAMSSNLQPLQAALADIEPTAQRADFPAALALSAQMLAAHQGPRHLVILSDFQATNWADLTNRSAAFTLPADTHIHLAPLDAAPPSNLALAEPAISPPRPLATSAAVITLSLVNHSPRPQATRIELRLDDQPPQSQSVTVEPWQKRQVAFDLTALPVGRHRAQLTIPDHDALAIDNRVFLAFHASACLPVLVLADDPPHEPGTSTYFLLRALAPFQDNRDTFEARLRTTRDPVPPLHNIAALFISDTSAWPEPWLRAVLDYLQQGGGVVILGGDSPLPQNLAALDQQLGRAASPWLPSTRRDLAASHRALFLGQSDWTSPLLEPFDLASQQALTAIPFTRLWNIADLRPEAQIHLRFADGTPALASAPIGAGRLILANFSPALTAGDLGKHGVFVALVHQLIAYLQPKQPAQPASIVGRP
ncbi:MAG TPA: VWA domain-containing protein, partial [Phycisphaeraceae bacterium]